MASCRRLLSSVRGWAPALAIVLALLVAIPLPHPVAPEALAAVIDCSDKNDSYQTACLLPPNTPSSSILATPNDVDYFRIEVLDFGATVNMEITEAPYPYRITIRDWKGDQVAAADQANDDTQRSVQFKPQAPGSYYVLVDSLFGDVNPTAAYSLVYKPVYPVSTPKVIYSADFRQPAREFSGTRPWGSYSAKDGKYLVSMTTGGQPGAAYVAVAWWPDSYRDFTMVTDVRLADVGQDAGFAIGFRSVQHDPSEQLRDDQADLKSGYLVLASTASLQFELLRVVDDKPDLLVPWRAVRSLRTSDQINHVVVRSIGGQHIVNINGEEVVNLNDPSLQEGRLILGAMTFGGPVTIIYDNLLVIAPS